MDERQTVINEFIQTVRNDEVRNRAIQEELKTGVITNAWQVECDFVTVRSRNSDVEDYFTDYFYDCTSAIEHARELLNAFSDYATTLPSFMLEWQVLIKKIDAND